MNVERVCIIVNSYAPTQKAPTLVDAPVVMNLEETIEHAKVI